MADVKNDVEKIQAQIKAFKESYAVELRGSIKQNPDIRVLSDNPRCFVIRSSALSADTCLSPTYYDFEKQRDILIAAIDQLPIESVSGYIRYVIKNESLPRSPRIVSGDRVLYEGGYQLRIHPSVIAKLREIFGSD
jgi:hypothetical protein